MELRFEDLFAFGTGLCLLRIYEGHDVPVVALAIEVEDNPGMSVVNAAEALLERIEVAFQRQSRLFLFYPEGPRDWTEVIPSGDCKRATFRNEVAQAEIESLIGSEVAVPGPTKWCAADLVAADHPLLALIPGDDEDERRLLNEMQVIAVVDLPWAHNPSRCAHFEGFETIRSLYEEGRDGEVPAGAHFFLSLDSDQFASCRYHRSDWKAIAAASVEIFHALDPEAGPDDVYREAARLLPEGPDQEELVYLFLDPIVWSPGTTSVTNGQHRTCALKAANAPECVVVTEGRFHDDVRPGDPRRRAESALAEFWASRLGR